MFVNGPVYLIFQVVCEYINENSIQYKVPLVLTQFHRVYFNNNAEIGNSTLGTTQYNN